MSKVAAFLKIEANKQLKFKTTTEYLKSISFVGTDTNKDSLWNQVAVHVIQEIFEHVQQSFVGDERAMETENLLDEARSLYVKEMAELITKSLKDLEYKTSAGTVLDICQDEVESHIDRSFDKTIKEGITISYKLGYAAVRLFLYFDHFHISDLFCTSTHRLY